MCRMGLPSACGKGEQHTQAPCPPPVIGFLVQAQITVSLAPTLLSLFISSFVKFNTTNSQMQEFDGAMPLQNKNL